MKYLVFVASTAQHYTIVSRKSYRALVTNDWKIFPASARGGRAGRARQNRVLMSVKLAAFDLEREWKVESFRIFFFCVCPTTKISLWKRSWKGAEKSALGFFLCSLFATLQNDKYYRNYQQITFGDSQLMHIICWNWYRTTRIIELENW